LTDPLGIQLPNKPLRARLYGKALEITRSFIRERQGLKCALCPSLWNEIDHIDGNPANNSPLNLRGLCKSCNIQQRNLQHSNLTDGVKESVSVCTEPQDALAINREKEPQWIHFTTQLCESMERVERSYLRKEASNYCNISPATHNRYLDKHTAPTRGFLESERDLLNGLIFYKLRKRPAQ